MTKQLTPAANAAAQVRAAIKSELGFNSRDVSVRCDNFSLGSSVDVTIKSAEAFDARARVEALARGAENVRRCEATGEILSGGNRYVSIDYSAACREIIARRHVDAVAAAIEDFGRSGMAAGQWVEIKGTGGVFLTLESGDWIAENLEAEQPGQRAMARTADELAFRVAGLVG